MLNNRLQNLKNNIESNYDILIQKCPITPIIYESLEIIESIDFKEEDRVSWMRNQRVFISQIEKVIDELGQTTLE